MLLLRPPPVEYPKKMSEKSQSGFLTLKTEDPASNSGIIALYKVINPNLAGVSESLIRRGANGPQEKIGYIGHIFAF